MNRAQRRAMKGKHARTPGDDARYWASLKVEEGAPFVQLEFELPSGELPEVDYTDQAALERWRRYCMVIGNPDGTIEEYRVAVDRRPRHFVEGDGATYSTRPVSPGLGRHTARLPALGGEQSREATGADAPMLVYDLAVVWLLRWYGPVDAIDGGGEPVYPPEKVAELVERLRVGAVSREIASERIGRWSVAYSRLPADRQLLTAKILTSASVSEDWEFLARLAKKFGVPRDVAMAVNAEVERDPEQTFRWLW